MKILYAIQGTGNGHLSRARAIIPELQRKGVQLDLLVSGIQSDIPLPFQVRYRLHGMSFIFGKRGGIDLWETYLKTNTYRIQQEIRKLPVREYDLVLNDFEPISAWACKFRDVPCIGLSHQMAVLSEAAPQPTKQDLFGKLVLRQYAPVCKGYGFHFKAYASGIYTPVIRKGIRNVTSSDKGHYTVYLPAYSDSRIISVLSGIPEIRWQVFSKHSRKSYGFDNVTIHPIRNEAFLSSIASCRGVLCAAGFETPSEALFLGKKLAVIPMKSQYEQHCNATALREMGIPVFSGLNQANLDPLKNWVASEQQVAMDYPDVAGKVVDEILEKHSPAWL